MGAKEWITVAFILVISAVAMLNVTEKSEPKMLQQKITMTTQTIDTIRSNANTYAGLVPTKDYTNLSMDNLKTKGIIDYPVSGTGATSTITAPFDDQLTFSIAPMSGNKKFTVTVTAIANTSMDAVQKQQFEDTINAYALAGAGTISGYTTTGADGKISLNFAN